MPKIKVSSGGHINEYGDIDSGVAYNLVTPTLFDFVQSNQQGLQIGTGTPEGSKTARRANDGYYDTDAKQVWVHAGASGNTGWVNATTASLPSSPDAPSSGVADYALFWSSAITNAPYAGSVHWDPTKHGTLEGLEVSEADDTKIVATKEFKAIMATVETGYNQSTDASGSLQIVAYFDPSQLSNDWDNNRMSPIRPLLEGDEANVVTHDSYVLPLQHVPEGVAFSMIASINLAAGGVTGHYAGVLFTALT